MYTRSYIIIQIDLLLIPHHRLILLTRFLLLRGAITALRPRRSSDKSHRCTCLSFERGHGIGLCGSVFLLAVAMCAVLGGGLLACDCLGGDEVNVGAVRMLALFLAD